MQRFCGTCRPALAGRSLFKGLGLALATAVTLTAAVELTLRAKGYGDPPLFEQDASIEYMLRPGRHRRFGNTIYINAEHMRSAELKNDGLPRLALLGDSIVFGTYQLDQGEVLGAALAKELEGRGRGVEVLGIAAPSWGPPNQDAFLSRFGLFNAQAVVWVLSSHDYTDVPVPGYSNTLPLRKPRLAVEELAWWLRQRSIDLRQPPDAAKQSAAAIRRILALIARAELPLLVVLHPSLRELSDGPEPAALELHRLFASAGVPVLDLRQTFAGVDQAGYYQDQLHQSPAGCRRMARAIADRLAAMRRE